MEEKGKRNSQWQASHQFGETKPRNTHLRKKYFKNSSICVRLKQKHCETTRWTQTESKAFFSGTAQQGVGTGGARGWCAQPAHGAQWWNWVSNKRFEFVAK